MRKFINNFSFLVFIVFSTMFLGQDKLFGTVYNAAEKPISDVRIYIDGTQIRTLSNTKGEFEISANFLTNSKFVIAKEGYENRVLNLDEYKNKKLKVLLEKERNIEEVIIKGDKHHNCNKCLKIFSIYFLGHDATDKVEIKNKGDLKITHNISSKIIRVFAKKPLRIINKILGYEIEYDLKEFYFDENLNKSFYMGTSSYKDLEGGMNKRKTWLKTRKNSYYGSIQHFIRSAYKSEIIKENFSISELKKVPNPLYPNENELKIIDEFQLKMKNQSEIEVPEEMNKLLNRLYKNSPTTLIMFRDKLKDKDILIKENEKTILKCDNVLQVNYFANSYVWDKNELLEDGLPVNIKSQIQIEENKVELFMNGNYSPPDQIIQYGDWVNNKLNYTLPLDYDPEEWRAYKKNF